MEASVKSELRTKFKEFRRFRRANKGNDAAYEYICMQSMYLAGYIQGLASAGQMPMYTAHMLQNYLEWRIFGPCD